MAGKIILSFGSFISDFLASRNPAVHTYAEMFYFVMTVQSLLCQRWGSPGAVWLAVEVTPPLRTCPQPTIKLLGRDYRKRRGRMLVSGRGNKLVNGITIRVVLAIVGRGARVCQRSQQ